MKDKEKKEKKNRIKIKKKHILITFVILILCAIATPFICHAIVQNVGGTDFLYIDTEEGVTGWDKKDAAIVPCAAVSGGLPLSKGKDRCNAAIELYEQGLINEIIVSGSTVDEVEGMAQYLMINGIPKEVISLDSFGVDTYETISRTKEKFQLESYYFCTQEMYAGRARYLMSQMDMNGQVICVDTMYYSVTGENMVREFLAATKAVAEPIIYGGNTKISIKEKDFVQTPELRAELVATGTHVAVEDLEPPKDAYVVDSNPDDEYDVEKAVTYARKYALEANPQYPMFEQNCTNFVSQCLVEGGIIEEGLDEVSDSERYVISDGSSDWFSESALDEETGRMYYSTCSNFINTDKFIEYFTEERGYKFSIYNNDYDGKVRCYNEIKAGDVFIFYDEDNTVAHIGLITGIGDMNVYYCGNSNAKKDYSVFSTNDRIYPKIGVLHMSEKNN